MRREAPARKSPLAALTCRRNGMAGPGAAWRRRLMRGLLHPGRFVPPVLVVLFGAAPFSGLCVLYEKPSVYEKDGVRYGVTKGTFRSLVELLRARLFYLDGGYYAEAAEDFRAALQDRSKDQPLAAHLRAPFHPGIFPQPNWALPSPPATGGGGYPSTRAAFEQHYSARAAFTLPKRAANGWRRRAKTLRRPRSRSCRPRRALLSAPAR